LSDIGLPQALDLEQRQRHERVAMALLVEQEQDDQDNGACELPEGPSCAPADGGGVHQRVDQEKHAARDETSTDHVEVAQRRRLGPFAVDDEKRRHKDDRYDREVDKEHPSPTHLGGEHAAEEHSGSA
jgi:hypothetical protein